MIRQIESMGKFQNFVTFLLLPCRVSMTTPAKYCCCFSHEKVEFPYLCYAIFLVIFSFHGKKL